MSSQKKEVRLLSPMVLGEAPVWHYCTGFDHFGINIEICIDIYWDEENPTKIKVCGSFDGHRGCYSVDVSDFACIPIEVPDIPVGFKICFDDWHVTNDEISFDITLKACAFLCIKVYSYKVTIPTTALSDDRAGKLSSDDSKRLKEALAINTPKYFNAGGSSSCGCSK